LILNVQLRLRGGIPYVFEINPRFSSTLMMRHKIGFQDFIWTLDYLTTQDKPPAWHIPEGHYIYRVSDEVIVNPEQRA
jgi:carbamoyl-phosphate synthase large subunit